MAAHLRLKIEQQQSLPLSSVDAVAWQPCDCFTRCRHERHTMPFEVLTPLQTERGLTDCLSIMYTQRNRHPRKSRHLSDADWVSDVGNALKQSHHRTIPDSRFSLRLGGNHMTGEIDGNDDCRKGKIAADNLPGWKTARPPLA